MRVNYARAANRSWATPHIPLALAAQASVARMRVPPAGKLLFFSAVMGKRPLVASTR